MPQSRLQQLRELLVEDKKFSLYSFDEYLRYCATIRTCFESEDDADSIALSTEFKDFFEQKFVQEMEPLAKIADLFGREQQPVARVQFVKSDPPDGRIILADGREIGIECMSARNDRLIKFALEQTRQGTITSTSGHTVDDIHGSKHRGYSIAGYAVEAEELCEKHQKTIDLLCDRMLSKIPKLRNAQWLSVFIDEFELPDFYQARLLLLQSVVPKFNDQLVEKGITDLFFVGNKGWLTRHQLLG
jgi:hypothetical protein